MIENYFENAFDDPMDKVWFMVFILISSFIVYFIIKRKLSNTMKLNNQTEEDKKSLSANIKHLSLAYVAYFIGLGLSISSSTTIGFFMAALGISLAIYHTQKIESYSTIILIEKKLGTKIDKVTAKNLEGRISSLAAKEIASKIDINKLREEIKAEILEEIKSK